MKGYLEKLKEVLMASREKGAEALGELLAGALQDMSFTGDTFTVGAVGQFAPGLISIWLDLKRNQFETRMEKLAENLSHRIEVLEQRNNQLTIEKQEFIEHRLLPFVIDRALAEDQESKIDLIINGFENIITLGMTEEDTILAFYDILKELRHHDITRLVEISHNPRKTVEIQERFLQHGLEQNNTPKQDANHSGFIRYIDRKLEGLTLVSRPTTWGELEGGEVSYKPNHTRLTHFGIDFLSFFQSRQK